MAEVKDPQFQQALNDYIDAVIESEKKKADPSLEPFEEHAEKIRKNIKDAMTFFHTTYHNGYKVLLNQLKDMIGDEKQQRDPLSKFKVSRKNLGILTDPNAFIDAISQGQSLYEIFGFSEEVLKKFYEAGFLLVEKKRFEDARDGFYFLVSIAPTLGEAWLGLGYSYARCNDMNGAIQAFTCAIELMNQKAQPYLTFARVYIEAQDFEQALKVCDIGLNHALKNRPEPWAEELGSMMEEAKGQIMQMVKNTEYQSYSS